MSFNDFANGSQSQPIYDARKSYQSMTPLRTTTPTRQEQPSSTASVRRPEPDIEAGSFKETDSLLRSDNPQGRSQQQQTLYHTDLSEEMIRERDREIHELGGTIRDVNDIFRDLAHLVQGQQAGIDSISSNVLETHETTTNATKELGSARGYQIAAQKKACIFMIILLFIVGILVLLIMYN
eukprot:TRINITY_DN19254_c0_g1::TRINITY_DN19254_c0_g1_i1::g.15880::m.15880 TRINITY_DN19254_c0_g1::TRINITY_DN19254_c0_g1_i1::g.15880  ORF type:complete len:181 (+),score=8.37,sp/Q5RBW6/STX12_PONAB/41.25/1e-11,SNARE/PF05739.14/1.1e-13,MCPsignal/PF00015.16/0.00088,DUF912/PF06024.7/4.9e+03,DUF912/PF06024.7/0.16 TRINITY_DN19254_c0_g1_i1:86-628(+)